MRFFLSASYLLAILPYVSPMIGPAIGLRVSSPIFLILPWLLVTTFALFKFPGVRWWFLGSAAVIGPWLLMVLFILACSRNHSCP